MGLVLTGIVEKRKDRIEVHPWATLCAGIAPVKRMWHPWAQMSWHVYPTGDEREHQTDGLECWCEPLVQFVDPETGEAYAEALVIHNSADGRELVEQAEEIKNATR